MKLSDFIKDVDKTLQSSEPSASELELILDILKKINGSLYLPNVLELVLKSAINVTKSERGFIVLKNENGNLKFELCLDENGKLLPEESFYISTTVVNEVYSSGQSKFIESALTDSDNASQSIINLELQTIMCSPLTVDSEKIGVIYVDSRVLNKIKRKEITKTFEILASQAGIAINNALMHQKQVEANTELKKAYQYLEKARQEADRLATLKDHFLLQISHEIRTPFNIILGSIELLRSGKHNLDSDEMKELFTMVELGSNRIIRTMDQIIEMSKIRSGNQDIKFEMINIDSIVAGVVSSYLDSAKEKDILLTYEKFTTLNEVRGDRFMISQIVKEILDNAIKFTEKGSVTIKQFKTSDEKLCISVVDSGIGISKQYLEHIYEPFTQEDTGYTRKYDGNGLALALVKKYADINNILLQIRTEKNAGTEFNIIFN